MIYDHFHHVLLGTVSLQVTLPCASIRAVSLPMDVAILFTVPAVSSDALTFLRAPRFSLQATVVGIMGFEPILNFATAWRFCLDVYIPFGSVQW